MNLAQIITRIVGNGLFKGMIILTFWMTFFKVYPNTLRPSFIVALSAGIVAEFVTGTTLDDRQPAEILGQTLIQFAIALFFLLTLSIFT